MTSIVSNDQQQPAGLDPEGRDLSAEEMENLMQHFDGIDYLTQTMETISGNIAEAKDTAAASTWVQWLLNAALVDFDSIMESINSHED